MSRYQFEAGDERYSVGYMPELASYFADVEPLEVDDELDELVELVDSSKVGAIPTLAHLDALLGDRGVRIPQEVRELLADESAANPAEAAMDAADARRAFFADLGAAVRRAPVEEDAHRVAMSGFALPAGGAAPATATPTQPPRAPERTAELER